MKQVSIVLPGIMGSELRLNGELIWPGPASSLVLPYKQMAELKSPDLEPTDIIRSFSFSDQYQKLIDDLALCGFREGDQTLFVCPYDWRKSMLLAAEVLANKVDAALAAHGGRAEISLIAHSMGGMVSRCYLESGNFQKRPGFAVIRRLITLGTPHRGAPVALTAPLGLEKRLFLSAQQVQEIANDTRYPGLYELLPPRDEPFVWNSQPVSAFGQIDVYDQTVAAALGLNTASLSAAERFHATLDLKRRPAHVRYFFFTGSSQKTLATVSLRPVAGSYRVERIERENGGDGTVPFWSGGITAIQGQAVGGEHGTIYKDKDLRRTLAILLGKAGVLSAIPDQVQVTIKDRVCEPNAPLCITLAFSRPVRNVQGELRIERVTLDAAGQISATQAFGDSLRISFDGPELEQLSVQALAPNVRGLYRIGYIALGELALSGSDELFVQEPTT
jgi:pimeloyl-ACP methyl ester carboxylesterase